MKEGEEFIMLLPGLGGSVGSLLSHVMAGGGESFDLRSVPAYLSDYRGETLICRTGQIGL
jgi:hypothetical protein